MSTLLYIDTSAATATIALSQNGKLLALRRHQQAQEQAAMINLMIEDVLKTTALSFAQVDALCICAGPGSYTGLRVGLSTAKGIAYALDKPLMLFNKLELIAHDLRIQHNTSQVTVALKARLGEYFTASYNPAEVVTPQHIFEAQLNTLLEQPHGLLVSDTDINYPAGEKVLLAADYALNIETWLPVAEARFHAQQFDDLAYSEPFYLKAAFTTQPKK